MGLSEGMGASGKVERALRRIDALDNTLKAFITLDAEGARRAAAPCETQDAPVGPLAGLTTAIKDLTDTADLRTTYGSWYFRDHVPTEDDLVVARLRQAGAIVLGKTMTPEFGFGALCANRLHGPTANPWNPALTSGGSSGGAAVAVAAGMVDFAHGTDFGGSVRTPAGFCGVVSLRPTPGMLPNPKRARGYDMLATAGFLARDVAMLERVLAATAGPHPLDPLSTAASAPAPTGLPVSLRIAATADFGVAPIAEEVRDRFSEAVRILDDSFGPVAAAHPDCGDAFPIFHTLRPAHIRRDYGALPPDALSETVRWWIERGAGISADAYLAAEAARTAYARRFVRFFDQHDVLVAPAASVMPWPNTIPEVTEIDGAGLETIVDYLAVTFAVTLAGCPVVTLPAPKVGHALPFGLQIIGPPWSDWRLLAIARRIEAEAGFAFVAPPLMEPEG